jgi:hypothetical protein
MKKFASLGLVLPLIGCTTIQVPAESAATEVAPEVATPMVMTPAEAMPVVTAPVLFTSAQLDQLLGPIALYPDALIALILPAATSPSQVVLASRYVRDGADLSQIDAQPWDDSVRAIAHYPEVLNWMSDNVTWTQQLGAAFASQSADVMNAIQRLRAAARAAGTLVDTPQQRVIFQDGAIAIVPAQPDVIYVPYYDPAVVYAPPPSYYSYPPTSYFNFSRGFASGWWLSFGVDWRDRCVWTVNENDRQRYWREHEHDWHRHFDRPHPGSSIQPEIHAWHPRPGSRPGLNENVGRPPRTSPTPAPYVRHDDARRDAPRDWRNDARSHDRAMGGSTTVPAPVVNPAATPPPFVGPTAMQPLPAQAQPTPAMPPNRRGDWRGGRGRDTTPPPPTTVAPSPATAPSTPPPIELGARQPRPVQENRGVSGRSWNPATPPAPMNPAPAPRHVPPIHMAAPPAPPATAPADTQPAPQQTAQPQQAQPQQQQQSDTDDSRKRPPFIRMR